MISGKILVGGLFAYEVFTECAEKEEETEETTITSTETETAIHNDL